MNHLYKVIWNKARACWQVVSELAGGSGKLPSARRRGRRSGAAGSGGHGRLAVTMAIMLAISGYGPLPLGKGSVACAAVQETDAAGPLGYGISGKTSGTNFFRDLYGGQLSQARDINNPVVMGLYPNPTVSYINASGVKQNTGIGSVAGVLNNIKKTAYGAAYNSIVAVVNLPDPVSGKPFTVYTLRQGTVNAMTYRAVAEQINQAYFLQPDVAQKIADAYAAGDEALLTQLLTAGVPRLYAATDGDWQAGTLLTVETAANSIKFGDYQSVYNPAPPSSGNPGETDYAFSYQSQNVDVGDIWRPLDRAEINPSVTGDVTVPGNWLVDASGAFIGGDSQLTAGKGLIDQPTVITVKDLSVGRQATVDLSYLNTRGSDPLVSRLVGGSYETDYFLPDGVNRHVLPSNRTLFAQNATLADGVTFRLGAYYAAWPSSIDPVKAVLTLPSGYNDEVMIANAATPDGNPAKLYIELGWVDGIGRTPQGEAKASNTTTASPVVLGILNGADLFAVEGRTTLADGIFSMYEITPVIGKKESYFTDPADSSAKKGTAWYLDSYSYVDTGMVSESGQTAADNMVASHNLWKSNYLSLFRRNGTLHRNLYSGQAKRRGEHDQRENLWAETWNGKYKSASAYGRRVDQSYDGLQVGYDKELAPRVGNGKVYAGFYLSKLDGESHTASGSGEQDSVGGAVYASWLGDRGHYLDLGLVAAKLKNDFHFFSNTGGGVAGIVRGEYSTWGYGLGLKYGYRDKLRNGWFWEPSAGLFIGHVDETDYSLSNALGITMGGYDTVTSKLGLSIGKEIPGGELYAGVAAYREFAGRSDFQATYGAQTRPLDSGGGRDTWYEFNLGGNFPISPSGMLNINLLKTTGSDIANNDWTVNGGLNWTWGGFWGGGNGKQKTSGTVEPVVGTLMVGKPASPDPIATIETQSTAAVQLANTAATADSKASDISDLQETAAVDSAPSTAADGTAIGKVDFSAATADAASAYIPASGDYTFAPLTVEASRPDWEKKLSPGQVSVVYPSAFEGEQKDLPDLLDRVPGLFVQRISGDGHYTVARVRGSTGAQVNVYVDGVLMNLNGDAAVNLSTIPVDNVERIEVYRGYVPARFSGSPLGGVINIVTKKPDKIGGSISQSMRSYGGYTGNYQLTMPVGDGSLLATYQRDIWDGDFRFQNQPYYRAYIGDDHYGDLHRRSNGYQNSNGMVKWQNDNWMAKVSWKQLHEELPRSVANIRVAIPGDPGIKDNYNKGYYDAEQDIDQKEFQIGWRDTVGSLDWGWKAYYLDSQKDYIATGLYKSIADNKPQMPFTLYPGFLWSSYHSRKWGGNLNAAMKLGDSHLLELNFDYSRESMDANGSNWDDWNSNEMVSAMGRQYLPHYTIREYHLTLQDSISLNRAGDFKLTPLLRSDRVEMATMSEGDGQWKHSGAVALQKQLNEHWGVKTSWGTYNRHPNFYELFGDGGSLRPNPQAEKYYNIAGRGVWETGHQFDFSVNWQGELLNADTDTVATWFRRRSKNQFALFQSVLPNMPASYFPMDEARVHGVELTHSMSWQRLTLSLAGTWQKSSYTQPGLISNGIKSVISYTPEWVWNTRLDYRLPGDKASLFAEYRYIDGQVISANGDVVDGYMRPVSTVGLGVKYAFDANWKLTAGVNDIFNKGYDARSESFHSYGRQRDTLASPLAGRMYYTTMEYRF